MFLIINLNKNDKLFIYKNLSKNNLLLKLMNPKIIKIENGLESKEFLYGENYDGIIIHKDDNTKIKFLISTTQYCCENWGFDIYYTENDKDLELPDFSKIEISILDIKWSTDNVVYSSSYKYTDYKQVAIINVYTNFGIIQMVLWNEHNGYYSHSYILEYDNKIEKGDV